MHTNLERRSNTRSRARRALLVALMPLMSWMIAGCQVPTDALPSPGDPRYDNLSQKSKSTIELMRAGKPVGDAAMKAAYQEVAQNPNFDFGSPLKGTVAGSAGEDHPIIKLLNYAGNQGSQKAGDWNDNTTYEKVQINSDIHATQTKLESLTGNKVGLFDHFQWGQTKKTD